VILDFSIPPWFLATARKSLKAKAVPLDYVILRPAVTVCAARVAARPVGKIADYAIYQELYASFGDADRHTIQDDVSDPTSLAALIREGLAAGKFRVS
jgi:hypothetical protein